jgi:5-methyltetrahydropteroyltriglutamate--homocysteine methyltransferase
VLEHVPPDKVTLSSDCGMKPLARMVAKMKLRALTEGAKMVRSELMGTR